MNTLDKVYNLTVDIKNIDTKYNSYAKFFDDDRETSVIKVKILNNNSPIDLENCSVEAYFVLANNTYHNETCKIINSSEGIVELQLCQKCLVKGKNIVRLSILKDNEIANTPIITYEVRKGLYSDNPNFNDDPLTPILSQMLLDIKVTKVNQIELQERYEKTLPKIEGKIEEVDNAIDRVNNAIASGTQDLEVKEARVDKNGKSYSKLGDRLDSVDSQLAHIAINVVNFGAKGDGLADDTEAFINALNYAKGKGRVIIPPGTYRISRTLPFYSNMIIEGNITSSHISSKDYPMIIFEGENYLFDSIGVLDEVVSDYSYIKLGNLRIKSVKDAGGFLAFNRDREFENAPDKPISQGHLLRFIAENLIIEKEVDASGIASKNTNSIAINVVGLMNSTIKNCEFRGWNLALRLYQSDINTFDHCWFVSNLKVLESNHLNTYGSQNVFRDCDFEVRRNNTENNWMFEDTSYFLKFDNCYFEIGSSAFTPTSKPSSHATYNRIKGWFNFSSGKDCTFSNCRWDWIDDFASDCFMNIENKRSLVNFVSCSNVAGFNNDFSKKVRVNHMPKMATDYDNLSDYGRVNLISCSKYFITFFDLEHPNVFISNKNVELDEVKYNNIVYGEKGFIYDYRTKAPSKSGTYDMYYDEKSKKPYVFKLNKLNKKQDQLRFKTILGKNSMFELHKTHNIRIRARSLSDSQNSKIAIRLYHYRGESLIKATINYNSTINNINYKDNTLI